MHLLQSAAVLGLVCLDAAIAVPTAEPAAKLTKRTITVPRVAAGWKQRDILHSKYIAMQKFGMPVPHNLASAHARTRNASKKRHKKHHHGKAAAGGDGVATVTVTVTAGANGGGAASATAAASVAPSVAPSAVPSAASSAPAAASSAAAGGGGAGQPTAQTGDVVNNPTTGDTEFLSEITVGGQKMTMDFDTGSSDLWLFSTHLAAQDQQGHEVFDPTKSATFKAAGADQTSFSIQFGDGSTAAGSSPDTIGTDVVNIGGAVSQQQTIELADTVSGSFIADTASNGLVGLAFSSINTVKPQPAKTFFDTIADDLEQPILGANLKHGAAGSYTFGKVDTTAFTGQLTEVPIDNSQGFWQFPSSTFSVNGAQPQTNTQNSPAIADTGTTLLLADDDVVNGYYSQVQGAQLDQQSSLVVFPCSSTLPDLSLAVGGSYQAVIPGSQLNFQTVDKAGTTCAGALQSNNGAGIQIYGDIFFKAQYVVFNIRKNTISVAPHS